MMWVVMWATSVGLTGWILFAIIALGGPRKQRGGLAVKRIGIVTDAGGGMVDVMVDRDLDTYPTPHTVVYIDAIAGRRARIAR